MGKRNRKKSYSNFAEKMKLEIARELGLLEKVKRYGWSGLTAQETGRIGGIIARRKQSKTVKKSEKI